MNVNCLSYGLEASRESEGHKQCRRACLRPKTGLSITVEMSELDFGCWIVPCQQWQDICEELPPEIAARLLPPETKKKEEEGLARQMSLVPADLSATEHAVLKLLSADEAAHIDELAARSQLSVPELTAALLGLEMRELIRQLPGKCFVRKM
jgi:hypothetical protein